MVIQEEICPICLDNFKVGNDDIETCPCGHQLHKSCFTNYIAYGYTDCCICKKCINPVIMIHIEEDNCLNTPDLYSIIIRCLCQLICINMIVNIGISFLFIVLITCFDMKTDFVVITYITTISIISTAIIVNCIRKIIV